MKESFLSQCVKELGRRRESVVRVETSISAGESGGDILAASRTAALGSPRFSQVRCSEERAPRL